MVQLADNADPLACNIALEELGGCRSSQLRPEVARRRWSDRETGPRDLDIHLREHPPKLEWKRLRTGHIGAMKMTQLTEAYKLPPELVTLVESGFLELLSEDAENKTVEFYIPSRRASDNHGRIASVFNLIWIHPDHNAEFCHYYDTTPGDLASFYVSRSTPDHGDRVVPDLNTLDDLIAWLEDLRDGS